MNTTTLYDIPGEAIETNAMNFVWKTHLIICEVRICLKNEPIEQVSKKAQELIAKIPFAIDENIRVIPSIYSDPIVTYESRDNGYYEIVNERGSIRETKVAHDTNEMIQYFVHGAIVKFAHRYEWAHRRKFESNLRQVHEVMEKCYRYIDPNKKYVNEKYEDINHIYLDLFDQYRQIAQEYKIKYSSKYKLIKEDIDFIVEKKYADTPNGGMHDLSKSMSQVRNRISRLIQSDTWLKYAFEEYEMYYTALEKEES